MQMSSENPSRQSLAGQQRVAQADPQVLGLLGDLEPGAAGHRGLVVDVGHQPHASQPAGSARPAHRSATTGARSVPS